jgi:hypothetical protein
MTKTFKMLSRIGLGLGLLAAVLLAGSCGPFDPLAAAGEGNVRVFWVTDTSVYSARLDGSDRKILYTAGNGLTAVGVDPIHDKLYWIDDVDGNLFWANLDGSGVDIITQSLAANMAYISVDPEGGKVYLGGWGEMLRCDLDGTNLQSLSLGTSIACMDIDPIHRRLYWVDDYKPFWADLPDTDTVVGIAAGEQSTNGSVTGLVVDGVSQTLFWICGDEYYKMPVGGTAAESLPLVSLSPVYTNQPAFDVDPYGKYIYWAEDNGGQDILLYRAPFGGASAITLMSSIGVSESVEDVALYLGP